MPTNTTIVGGSWQFYNSADTSAAAYVNASGIDVYTNNGATHNYNTSSVTGEIIATQITNRKVAENFWSSGYKGKGVKVAILDTGVRSNYTLARILGKVNVQNIADITAEDTIMHGTRAASVVAELPNGHPWLNGTAKPNGIVGIAHECDLYVVQISNGSSGTAMYPQYNTGLAKGLQWCLDNGIDIAITSSANGGDSKTRELTEQCVRAGMWICASAGNIPMNASPAQITYPAAYPGVFCIGAKQGGHVFVEQPNTAYNSVVAVGNKAIDYLIEPYIVSAGNTPGAYYADIGTSQSSWIFGAYLTLLRQILNEKKMKWDYTDVVNFLAPHTAVNADGFRYIPNFDFIANTLLKG